MTRWCIALTVCITCELRHRSRRGEMLAAAVGSKEEEEDDDERRGVGGYGCGLLWDNNNNDNSNGNGNGNNTGNKQISTTRRSKCCGSLATTNGWLMFFHLLTSRQDAVRLDSPGERRSALATWPPWQPGSFPLDTSLRNPCLCKPARPGQASLRQLPHPGI